MCWEACRQALHGNSPYTQSTIWLFRRGRERIEQGSQPVLLVLFGFALQVEQGEMETWGAAPWAWLLLRQGAIGDLSKGLSLLSAMELAVKMSPVCTDPFAGCSLCRQMEQPASCSPCTKKHLKGSSSARFGQEPRWGRLQARSCLCHGCPRFMPLLPGRTGSLLLTVNPPFLSPLGRKELNKYLYLCL